MCGICGIMLRDSTRSVPEEKLSAMRDQMQHRGPDAEGIYLDGNVGLGHRRLKIIDLAGGIQPMSDGSGNIVIVFNGEIYNFKEIRAVLEAQGHRFNTVSDTEVIIQAYLAYGEDCVDHFRGMFAIAIHDKNENKLLLLRDRLGIKPLYYYLDDEQFIFASEIKPLLVVLGKKPAVNISALDFYLTVGYVPGELTMFEHIKKLEPGHLLRLRDNKLEISSYWNLQDGRETTTDFNQALIDFEKLARESIGLRMRSDVPLGAFLSGGLDSSVIVAMMSDASEEPINTFSVGYKDDPESSELEYARIVARHFNTNHHEYILEPLDFFDSLDLLLDHMEEPVVESAAVALYQLSKLAKQHVTVILSGEGGDEILAGYPLHRIMPKVDKLAWWTGFLPKRVQTFVSRQLAQRNEKYAKYWDWACQSLPERYRGISNDVTCGIKREMYLDPELFKAHRKNAGYFSRLFGYLAHGSDLQKMTYVDLKTWLADDLLVKADKMTMAASLELRVPFLDHKLLEYSTALPDSFRIRGNEGKFLLKKLAEKFLPHEIIYRKKKGFPVPIATWFRGELYDQVREILLEDRTLARGYFQPNYIEKILRQHRSGRQDLSRRIFALLNIELWHRKYIDA